MNNSSQRKFGVILSYVSIIVNTFVQLLYTPLLIKNLGQSEYGLYSLISSIIGYLTVLDLGFGNALVVFSNKYRANNEYEKEAKLFGMFKIVFYVIGVIVAILGCVLYLNVDNFFGKTMTQNELNKISIMMIILIINLVITFAFNIYQSIITAYEKFTFQKMLAILNTILKPIIMIPLLFLGFKSITMCVVLTLVNVFVVLSNYFYCKNKIGIKVKFQGFDKDLFKVIFSYSFFIFLSVIVDKINWSVDQFILGMVSGTVAVSVYSVASQLNMLFINLSNSFSGVLLPKISTMVASGAGPKELTNEMIKVGRLQFYVIFLMVTGLIFVGKEFIYIWAGPEFELSYYVALLLIIPLCFPLIQNVGVSILQALNKHKFKAIATSIMAIINIFVSYFLALNFGVIGTAVGTAGALIICNIVIMNIYYKKALKLDVILFWKNIFFMFIKYIPLIIFVILFINILNLKGLISVLVYGSVYSLLYCIISYFFIMNEYEKDIIKNVTNKFKRIVGV